MTEPSDENKDLDLMKMSEEQIFNLSKPQRLQLLANLIAESIEEDKRKGYPLFKKIQAENRKTRKDKSNKR